MSDAQSSSQSDPHSGSESDAHVDTAKHGLVARLIGDKRRWRQYKARVRRLPTNYRMAVEAVERYVMHFGPGDGADAASLYEDIADLFEQAAADGTPVRAVVGEDLVEFAEALIRNYAKLGYVQRERNRLNAAIDRAVTAGADEGSR